MIRFEVSFFSERGEKTKERGGETAQRGGKRYKNRSMSTYPMTERRAGRGEERRKPKCPPPCLKNLERTLRTLCTLFAALVCRALVHTGFV